MSKTYELYHSGEWIPATFIKDADDDRVWLEYQHTEDDEDGSQKPAYIRRVNMHKKDTAVRIVETED